jgi:hypothetical protein
MLNTRSRKLTVMLAAGALSMFGASTAFAAGEGGSGGGGGGNDPMCKGTPLATTPFCAPGQQPPGGGGGGGGGGTPS